jgi:hypothetical protein
MKKLLLVAALGTLVAAVAGQSFAGASTRSVEVVKTIKVVMHDPGCHWFSAGGKFTTKLTVHGPVQLANYDEAALKVVGPAGTRFDKVGHKLVLARGVYRITMVKQASDDNHLKLTVN